MGQIYADTRMDTHQWVQMWIWISDFAEKGSGYLDAKGPSLTVVLLS
jgi:hypothetical protein